MIALACEQSIWATKTVKQRVFRAVVSDGVSHRSPPGTTLAFSLFLVANHPDAELQPVVAGARERLAQLVQEEGL